MKGYSTCVDLSGVEIGVDLLPVSKPPSQEIKLNLPVHPCVGLLQLRVDEHWAADHIEAPSYSI